MEGLWFNYTGLALPLKTAASLYTGPVGYFSQIGFVEPYAVADMYYVYAGRDGTHDSFILGVMDTHYTGPLNFEGLILSMTPWRVSRQSANSFSIETMDSCEEISEVGCRNIVETTIHGMRELCDSCLAPSNPTFQKLLDGLTPKWPIDQPKLESFFLRWRIGLHQPHTLCSAREGLESPATAKWLYALLQDIGWKLPALGYVNIGAADGIDDPLWDAIVAYNLTGIAIEGDPDRFAHLAKNFAQLHESRQIQSYLVQAFLTPENVVETLRDAAASISGDGHTLSSLETFTLKVDVDSYDCLLVEELLQFLDPMILRVEMNLMVPPPFKFVRQFASGVDFEPLYHHDRYIATVGCSMSYMVEKMLRHGFFLLAIDLSDGIFLRADVARTLENFSLRTWSQPIRFPQDEMSCFQKSLIYQSGVTLRQLRQWFFSTEIYEVLPHIRATITDLQRSDGYANVPFALYV